MNKRKKKKKEKAFYDCIKLKKFKIKQNKK